MPRIDGGLEHALAVWRGDLDYVEKGLAPHLTEAEVLARRVTVSVDYSGSIDDLRAAGLDTGYDHGDHVTGIVALADFDALAAVDGVETISIVAEKLPMLDSSVAELRAPWKTPPGTPWPGKGSGVIVAVIDTGIDIFHESFLDSAGHTRILEYWDQSAATGGHPPPTGFQQIGRLFTQNDIRDALVAGPPFVSVDTVGHGTHVTGTAAGNGSQEDRCSFPGRYVGVAPEADIIVVKAIVLPAGASSNTDDALQWCADARLPARWNKPVVINCSWGSGLGAHDGTGGDDVAVDRVLRPGGGAPPPGVAIVVSAGNSGGDNTHESGIVAANGNEPLAFTMPANSSQPDYFELWYTGAASLSVTISAPENPTYPNHVVGPVAPGGSTTFTVGLMRVAVNSSLSPKSNGKRLIGITIQGPPPPPPPAPPPVVAMRPGVWTLTLAETAGTAAVWDAWFATSHTDGFPTFKLKGDPDIPVPRRRGNTVGQPGTSRSAITVANYDHHHGTLNDSSSRGPDTVPAGTPVGELKPTVAAPGTDIEAPRSRDYSDHHSFCCDQKIIGMTGTSMASPHVVGLVALMLQKNGTLTFDQIRAHLQHSARIDGIPATEVPPTADAPTGIRSNALWGSGKVDGSVALAEMPAAAGGGGGGHFVLPESEWGYTPHTIFSRLGMWQSRVGPRPGLMLLASLVSEHVDEVMRLINTTRNVTVVWHKTGGPKLVRHLLSAPATDLVLLPRSVEGFDVLHLFDSFFPVLDRFGSDRLRADLARYTPFVRRWPGADLDQLDAAARLAIGRGEVPAT